MYSSHLSLCPSLFPLKQTMKIWYLYPISFLYIFFSIFTHNSSEHRVRFENSFTGSFICYDCFNNLPFLSFLANSTKYAYNYYLQFCISAKNSVNFMRNWNSKRKSFWRLLQTERNSWPVSLHIWSLLRKPLCLYKTS